MKHYVKIYKDGEHVAVQTNCTGEDDYTRDFSTALREVLGRNAIDEDETRSVLSHSYEILCKLRGYKSTAQEQRVLTSGPSNWNGKQPLVDTSSEVQDAPGATK